jgi:hypothetical protein
LTENGFICEDLFILVRQNRPGVSRMLRQAHSKKNHSYFIVFRKSSGKGRWKGLKNRPPVKLAEVRVLPLFPGKIR